METAREVRRGVVVDGRVVEWSREGVARPLMEKDACDDARERCDEATDAGRDGPEVGGESFDARMKTPHSCGQVK